MVPPSSGARDRPPPSGHHHFHPASSIKPHPPYLRFFPRRPPGPPARKNRLKNTHQPTHGSTLKAPGKQSPHNYAMPKNPTSENKKCSVFGFFCGVGCLGLRLQGGVMFANPTFQNKKPPERQGKPKPPNTAQRPSQIFCESRPWPPSRHFQAPFGCPLGWPAA